MMRAALAIGFILSFAALIRVALYFGYRWIDKMLCVSAPVDPNKPIVRPLP